MIKTLVLAVEDRKKEKRKKRRLAQKNKKRCLAQEEKYFLTNDPTARKAIKNILSGGKNL